MHLAIGEWVLARGVPDHDPFSYTSPGAEWVPHEWLAGVLFALVERTGGVHGLLLLAVAGALLLALVHRAVAGRLGLSATEQLLWLAPLWLISGRRVQLRPHLFAEALPFLLWWLLLLGRARPRLLGLVPLLFVVWVNFHGSYYLGIAILCLDFLLCARGHPVSLRWRAGILAASLAALLIQPFGVAGLIDPLRLTSDPVFMREILEWTSPFGSAYGSQLYRGTPGFALSVPWMLLAAAGLVWNRRGLPLSYRLFVVACGYLYLCHQRFAMLFALASLPALPLALLGMRWVRPRGRVLAIASALATTAAFGCFGYPDTWTSLRRPGVGWGSNLPFEEASYLAHSGFRGKVLCEYDYGGVLAWAGRGAMQVSMDSRNTVYGAEVFVAHQAALDCTPGSEAYREALLGEADAALVYNPLRQRRRAELFFRLELGPGWKRIPFESEDGRLHEFWGAWGEPGGRIAERRVALPKRAALLFLRVDRPRRLESGAPARGGK